MRARGRLDGWSEARANNAEEFPDPALPTYEGMSEWVEAEYVVRHVSVPQANIDYIKHSIAGVAVDPSTITAIAE